MSKVSHYKFNIIKNVFISQFVHLCDIFFKRFIINERREKNNIFELKDITNSFYVNSLKSFKKSY